MAERQKSTSVAEITRHFKVENAKIVALIMLFASLMYHGAIHNTYGDDVCRGLLTEGSLRGDSWQPQGCMIHKYTQKDIGHCMHDFSYWGRHNHIAFIGDSRLRKLYYNFIQLLGDKKAGEEVKYHSDVQFADKDLDIVVDFLWHPYVNQSMVDVYKRWIQLKPEEQPGLIITSVATWIIRDFEATPEALQTFKENMTHLVPYFNRLANTTTVLWVLQDPVVESRLDETRTMISNQQIDLYNRAAAQLVSSGSNAQIWSTARQVAQASTDDFQDGLHVGPFAAGWDSQMLFNFYCNDNMNFLDGTCCSKAEPVTGVQMATAAFFTVCIALSIIIFVWRMYQCPIVKPGNGVLPQTNGDTKNAVTPSKLDQFYDIVTSLAKLGIIMAWVFLCDRTTFLMKENKHYSHINFLLPFLYVMILGFFFSENTKQTAVLHRDQTDEWKGWMQLIILIYHMAGASGVIVIYMQIRVLVSSYLFMSGYGHFFYFWNKGDYSLYRFSQVMFRMNFLVVVLCFVMDRPYQFYYFVPLVSFWFLIIYVTMAIWPQVTAGSADKNRLHYFYMLLKFVIFAVIIALLYASESVFEKIFLFRPLKALFASSDDSIHEWRFRWWLDRHNTLYGMVFAAFLMLVRKYKLIQETKEGSLFRPSISWVVGIASIFGYGAYTVFTTHCRNKPECNNIHAYISFVPMLSFVLLRNLPAWLRTRYSSFFAWFGRISLELFISQYHIWLAADTVGVLVLVPGYPVLNVCVTTFIFVCIAHEIHILTGNLVAYCVPKDWKLILRNAGVFLLVLLPIALTHGVF